MGVDSAIATQSVSKRYGEILAVDALDLDVRRGEIYAFLGKNGWAEWFPWSIVPLSIGMVGQPVQTLPAGSYVVVGLTFLAGIVTTVLQLRYADNTQ